MGETLASANEPGTPYRLVVQKEPPHEVRPVAKLDKSFLGRKIQVIPVLKIHVSMCVPLVGFFDKIKFVDEKGDKFMRVGHGLHRTLTGAHCFARQLLQWS